MNLGKHIRLYLVDGSPTGILTAEIMGWTGKVLSFPRGLLPDALKRPECGKTGLYFLTGFDDEQGRPVLYIGESDDVAKRLKQHDADEDKAFFEQVALVVSKDENLTKSHVRYLENRLIDIARSNGMTLLKNGNQGSAAALPEAEQSDMEYLIQQLRILMPVLGLTFLQERPQRKTVKTIQPQAAANPEPMVTFDTVTFDTVTFELSYLNGQIRATAYEQDGSFIVEKGSIIRNLKTDAYEQQVRGHSYFRNRFTPYQSFCEPVKGNDLIVQVAEDVPFKSPTGAANFVTGTNINGHSNWKVKGTGQTYGDWRQAQLEQAEPQPERQEVGV